MGLYFKPVDETSLHKCSGFIRLIKVAMVYSLWGANQWHCIPKLSLCGYYLQTGTRQNNKSTFESIANSKYSMRFNMMNALERKSFEISLSGGMNYILYCTVSIHLTRARQSRFKRGLVIKHPMLSGPCYLALALSTGLYLPFQSWECTHRERNYQSHTGEINAHML